MSDQTTLFGVAPGIDFPNALVSGLVERMAGSPPEAMARVTLILNTRRMARRVRAIFDAGPPRLLPRILLLSDLDQLLTKQALPKSASPLRRRLELATFIRRLLSERVELAAQSSVFDLADSLAALMDEMQGEGVAAGAISRLDVSNHSEHFAQTQAFLSIIETYLSATAEAPDPETRQRLVTLQLIDEWQISPPRHPVVLAGSTASRGTTRILAEAVASLENGFVVLPGYDFEMPTEVWPSVAGHQLPAEDHPQFRFFRLQQNLGVKPENVRPWVMQAPFSRERNQLVSLALRPAPVTDAWRREGPQLGDLRKATKDVTFVQADSQRTEALAIAMRLREAVEKGETAALISPDRMLTRQVTAALDPWNILPDDSAGTPLHLSPSGRFLRHTANLLTEKMTAEGLLTLLKHPFTHSSTDRNWHNLNTQRLELLMRDVGMPFPSSSGLADLGKKLVALHGEEILSWLKWVQTAVVDKFAQGERPLSDWVSTHFDLSQGIARGQSEEASLLWQNADGEAALAAIRALTEHADQSDPLEAREYVSLLKTVLSAEDIRSAHTPHPDIMIWGTLEARVQGADLVILGSLNDGMWPEQPTPDPWLNRALRQAAGLLLPDRRIGLSAHDFQQAVAAKEVWLTRAVRSSDAETVPSRWVNRLTNLLSGLEQNFGPNAFHEMVERGDVWLAKARALERPTVTEKAQRPAPCPPVHARPRTFSVSDVRTLIRDPYAIYAKRILRLRPIGPLVPQADALLRGIAVHKIVEDFVRSSIETPSLLTAGDLGKIASDRLFKTVPWPAARALWNARIERIADWFVATEMERQARATPVAFEDKANGSLELTTLGVTVTARADRIDQRPDGSLILYDYKTSTPPSQDVQKHFERQLLIEAAMAEAGGFTNLGSHNVASAQYIGLNNAQKIVDAPIDDEPPSKVLAELHSLMASYLEPDQGYLSRRAVMIENMQGDYDQLARFGEWDDSAISARVTLE